MATVDDDVHEIEVDSSASLSNGSFHVDEMSRRVKFWI